MIVSTRGGVDGLAPVLILDLDASAALASGRLAICEYVSARLADLPHRDVVAEHVADGPFLRARLVVEQLRSRPVDAACPDRLDSFPASAGAALEADLGRVRDPGTRALLVALAWELGSGFPEGDRRTRRGRPAA